ncbi:MAG TPA: photosynthetic reaction center cytochrome c subunit family protein [Blastocatellia bacterium]|nr:photosynthetic reaction center cytochrome c subunit family protein [Blastocatellia bacterium]
MNKSHIVKLLSLILIAVPAVFFSAAQAQQQPGQPPAGQQPPPEPKNLQVLKGMNRQQVIQEMRAWSAALGVECNFCHQNPFEADTPRKQVARLMQRDYVSGLKHKDGSAVSCQDCHRGEPNPLRTQPYASVMGKAVSGLQVLPKERVQGAMQAFTKALGVKCEYCHTETDFGDETPRKQITRFMMTEFSRGLTRPDGTAIGCNDCHQGHAKPLSHLPFPHREQRPAPAPGNPPAEKKPNQ